MKTILCYGDSNTWGSIPGSEDVASRSGSVVSLLFEHFIVQSMDSDPTGQLRILQ